MTWIKKYISKNDIQKIEEAVENAERFTTGEIVPVIVLRSSAVGHVPLTLTLLVLVVFSAIEAPFHEFLAETSWKWMWPFLIIPVYYSAHLLAQIPWLQRIFVPQKDEIEQVHKRAQLEFHANKINRTSGGTGILIFVSVMERKAVVLADEGIAQKLPADTWQHILQAFRHQLSQDQWALGFQQAIEQCGELLKTHFPIAVAKENELKNSLIIKD
jgi:putative membrane protein